MRSVAMEKKEPIDLDRFNRPARRAIMSGALGTQSSAILLNPSLVHYSSVVCIEPEMRTAVVRPLHLLVHRSRDDEEAGRGRDSDVITFPSSGALLFIPEARPVGIGGAEVCILSRARAYPYLGVGSYGDLDLSGGAF